MYRFRYAPHADPADWDQRIAALPGAHVLQTAAWAQVKARTGWKPFYSEWTGSGGDTCAAGLVLEREAPLPGLALKLRVLYVPRGPLFDPANADLRRQVLADLGALARERGALFIKIDPDTPLGYGERAGDEDDPPGAALAADLQSLGWRLSAEQVQFRNTVWLDLTPSEDELLGRMKPKTRYNIRLAIRKGVQVRPADASEFPMLCRMYAETARRDDFVIRDEGYYLAAWTTMLAAGPALPLLAEAEGRALAGIIVYHFAGRAWYMHGMSADHRREWMPNYLLQWQAMLRLKALGITAYDLWGAPDVFDESDPLWGVYRFKQGLGGQVVRGLGAWDLPIRPRLYQLYTQTLPAVLEVMRRRGKARTRRLG